MIISHLKQLNTNGDEWELQSNNDHSEGVASLAEAFASEFGFGKWGRVLGVLHDKGKEQKGFQDYIKGVSGYDLLFASAKKTPHAFVGALIAKKYFKQAYPILSYAIMGHHAGLHDYDRLENRMSLDIPDDVSHCSLDIALKPPCGFRLQRQDWHHLIRILYSCLVDADFLDTENFMNEENSRIRKELTPMANLQKMLEQYLAQLRQNAQDTLVNRIRNEIQQECVKSSEEPPGFFSLTVPTGGGKTLSSLVWAILHAVKYQKKRIIIAIPYTSIIVQTAQILRGIFGTENVLEHHSNTDPEENKDKLLSLKMKLATENWDYPIIVTTNVQLFESIFSNKPSSCRKLHNICNSVLILDEVQVLPLEYLQPIVDSLKTYQRLFGVTVLFTTASQPVLKNNMFFGNTSTSYFSGIDAITEIIPGNFDLHKRLKRVDLIIDETPSSYCDIADRIQEYDRVLCIVNTRKDAQEIFNLLPKEGLTLHLSRMMCPKHIAETIERIKAALKNDNQIIRVVSTQLIEAGVDIDFPVVFRQEAGLDSLLQAAGRCNREGKQAICNAYVFKLNRALPKGYISNASNAQKSLSKDSDWFDPKTMKEYFIQLYSRTPTFDKSDITTDLNKPLDFRFDTAAQKFRLIQDVSVAVIVNYQSSMDLVQKLKNEGPNYQLMKLLKQYTVNVRDQDFKTLEKSGLIEEVISGVYLLSDIEQYKEDIGLVIENHWLEEILIK